MTAPMTDILAGTTRPAAACSARPAFSMPELMIALVVLGIGLLFIAAALPVGIEYSRRTADLSAAEAAAEHAFRAIERNVRTSRKLATQTAYWSPVTARRPRTDGIVRPRRTEASQPPNSVSAGMLPDNDWEPVIKVRPLTMENIGISGAQRGRRLVDPADVLASLFAGTVQLQDATLAINRYLESDVPVSFAYPPTAFGVVDHPSIAGHLRSYPPIEPVSSYRVEDFVGLDNFGDYEWDQPRATNDGDNPDWQQTDVPIRERLKAIESRVGWVAFYRRASYAAGSDPLLYEFIVVTTRRPSAAHRYAAQDYTKAPPQLYSRPSALRSDNALPVGGDRLFPTPWLVTFTRLPVLSEDSSGNTGYALVDPDGAGGPLPPERFLSEEFARSPRLAFRCTEPVGLLLPVGSILIPARNDYDLDGIGNLQHPVWRRQAVGFTPSAPDTVPIYRVIDRPDEKTVIVENPGLYPWNSADDEAAGIGWPVWIIPPAFLERDSTGQPAFEQQSPIVSVVRRTIRLHEYVE